ncbi:MAG: Cell division protein ftsA [Candidatus Magasanikbacteria bacterium GW2011_GWA2_46_17]|uniref:Cell division protein FtsA n=1 Tax=Candidatus Magasanikbacteria bacterium GW2011_GWA2_46_17 TaxID=1619042 RepID=A0A0G1R6A1_9BACT|nr:MAG: Cell division protein ftsA [Candidatus Magasanikbacteria bacterium GW2011_GWA2_46_17]
MSKNISVGIDIGSYQIKVVVSEAVKENEKTSPKIIGVGYAESRGLRHGYILNQEEVVSSLRSAISQAEKASGVKIRKAFVSIGGVGLSGVTSSGTIIISRADYEITDLDVRKVTEASLTEIPKTVSINRKVMHTVPIQFKVDGKAVYGKPIGMKGTKLEVKTLFITCLENHFNDLVETLGETCIEVEDVVAAPIAASLVTLSKTQKIAGCVLANIGSETVSIAVFENGIPISVEVFPFGGNDITNDIALGLKIPLEQAEDLKRGAITGIIYPKKKLDEIVAARLSDIFELIDAHLKKIGRNGLLPAGIVLTGGSSGMETIEDLAKAALRLPSRIASINFGDNKTQVKDASWSVAFGLCILGLSEEDQGLNGIKIAKKAGTDVMGWLKQFLP